MEFIRVFGSDPTFNDNSCYQHIASHTVVKVYPIYGVPAEDGSMWLATDDTKEARLVTHGIITADGMKYTCGSRKELEKLGIVDPKSKHTIGFTMNNENNREPIDLDDEIES